MNNTANPFYTTLQAGAYSIPSGQPCDAALPCSSSGGLSAGKIAGIVIGVVLGIALMLAIWGYWKRRQLRAWWEKGYTNGRKGR